MTNSAKKSKPQNLIHEQVDAAMQLSFDMFCVVDFDGVFIDLNTAWERTLGWDLDELYLKPFIELVHPEDRATTQIVMENHVVGRINSFRFENRYLHKDGSYRRLQWNSSIDPIRNIITAVARDITNERLSEEMFDTAFHSGPQAMLITAIDGRLLKCNIAFSNRLGLHNGEQPTAEMQRRSHPDELARDLETLANFASGNSVDGRFNKRYQTKSGQWVTFEVHAKVIKDAAGKPKYIVSILKDLTQEMELSSLLEKTTYKLTSTEKILKDTLDNLPSLVSYINKNFTYKFVNSSYQKWFKVSAEQCLGHRVADIVGKEALDRVMPEAMKALQGEAQSFERLITYKNGDTKYLHLDFIPDTQPDGSVPGFYNIVNDITKAKETEITLAQTVRAIESSSIMSISDAAGRIVFANENFSKVSGYSNEELLGKDHRILNSGTHSKDFFKSMWDTVLSGKIWTGEVCNKAKDGTRYWVRSSVAPIYDIYGNVAKLMSVRFDISDRKRTELLLAEKSEDLEKKQRLLNRILDGIPAPISHWNLKLENLHANKAYVQSYPQIAKGVGHTTLRSIQGEDFYIQFHDMIEKVLQGQTQTFEHKISQTDGSFRQSITSYIPDIENDQVQGFFSITTDVSEIKRLESEKNDAQTRMTNSAKMSSLGEMAGGIAHEINNPLAIILGKAGQLKRKIDSDNFEKAPLLEAIAKIESTAQRIVKIIKGLSAFSRNAEADPMERCKLSRIVDDTIELCTDKFKQRGVALSVSSYSDVEIECRAAQISQVLLNLLNNANDAIHELPEKWVKLDIQRQDEKVLLRIIDSGHGIPPEVLQKIMQPFFTTKGVGKGTGLGLSVSKSIVEIHHGKLSYEKLADNTCFVIELPMSQSPFLQVSTKKVA